MSNSLARVLPTGQNPRKASLPTEILAILRCPFCRAALTKEEIRFRCSRCERAFPFVNRIVLFVNAGSFGFQWQRYAQTQLDDQECHDSEAAFRKKTGFTPEELSGKWVLDVGCGMSRFAEVASRWVENCELESLRVLHGPVAVRRCKPAPVTEEPRREACLFWKADTKPAVVG